MAQGINGGNFFANVNAQFAKDLGKGDSQAAQTARNNSGLTAQTKKGSTPKNRQAGGEDGLGLSDAARNQLKSEAQQYADHVAEHGQEMAQQSGLSQADDAHEQSELQQKRGYDREQAELAESGTPAGYVRVESPEGEPQLMTQDEHAYLGKMDDPDFTDARVLDDIPDANLEAASATLETQMTAGVSKIANFKSDPKIDAVAETMEIEPAHMLSEPMDIVGPGNDKLSGPMSLEFPPEMERVAAEKAASELASGKEQEVFMAGAPVVSAAPVEAVEGPAPTAAAAKAAPAAETAEMPDVDAPAYANQAGQPQEPVKPSFMQRLRYLFSGDSNHIGGQPNHVGQFSQPMPNQQFQTQGPPFAGQAMDPSSFMQAQMDQQAMQTQAMAKQMSWTMGLSNLMMLGSMFCPMLMPMASFINFMPLMGMGGMGMGGLGMGGLGMGMGGMGMGGMGMGGMSPYGPAGFQQQPMMGSAPTGQMPGSTPCSMIQRYDPTPTEPGSVVVLDSFQPNQWNSAPQGEITNQALGVVKGRVARQELARVAPDISWVSTPQPNTPPSTIRNQLVLDLSGARVRMLDGAAQNLQGLAQEGLRNSAVNLPAAPTHASEAWGTYAGLRQAWTDPTPGQTGARTALNNYCRAFELDAARIMHSDPSIHGPERTKLQQALLEISNQADNNPQVKASTQNYQTAVSALAENKVSVVVTGGNVLGQNEMAKDRDGAELNVGSNFNKSIFSTDKTVTVGASYEDKSGKTRAWTSTDNVDVTADGELRVGEGGGTYDYGATAAAPKVSSALAALHAKHPDKSNGEILDLFKEQHCEALNGDGPPNLSKARHKAAMA